MREAADEAVPQVPPNEQDQFLKLVRDCAGDAIGLPGDAEEVLGYINTLNNWQLLQLLAEAASKE